MKVNLINLLILINYRFGNPDKDEMSILAPLTQCCLVRKSTLEKLIQFNDGPEHLSDAMRKSLSKDPVNPVLTDSHLLALDRRVRIVLHSIRECLIEKKLDQVIFTDEL